MTEVAHRGTIRPGRCSGMIDASERVAGRVRYTIDMAMPGMLHGRLLRSSTAHARITRIDTERREPSRASSPS